MNTLVIGSDHAGYRLKETLKASLAASHEIIDVGTNTEDSVDYPDFALRVGQAITTGRASKGILLCGSGVGASVAANKIAGIRAGLCHDHHSAHQGVEHDDMNLLVLGARVVGPAVALDLVTAFLAASFSHAPRHLRRLKKVSTIESNLHLNFNSRTL